VPTAFGADVLDQLANDVQVDGLEPAPREFAQGFRNVFLPTSVPWPRRFLESALGFI